MTSGKKSQVLCGFRHLSPLTSDPLARGSLVPEELPLVPPDKWQPPHICWVFGPLVTFPIFGRGATCPPYDLKSQKGQIEGIFRFYAASATCQGDKLKWTPTCQGTNCGARMFPGFLLNLSLFLSLAGGQLGVGPLSHGCAVPASRLPPRVLSASGRRPAPTDAAAETGRWATSHRDVAAPKGGAKSRLPLWGRCHAFGMTERATCPRRARALAS